MLYKNWMKETLVMNSDWPFSLGYKINFFSCNPHFMSNKHYIKRKKILKTLKRSDRDSQGYACSWSNIRVKAIVVLYTGNCPVRFMELVCHEVSHIVDYFLQDCRIINIDTEVRAYMMDWMIGKIMHTTTISRDLSKLPKKDKFKKNNKKDR